MWIYFYRIPDLYLFWLLSILFVVASILAVYLINRFVPKEIRYNDNPVIGNVSASISLMYGVLAGLTALYLINNISATADTVQREVNAIGNIYRDSKLIKNPEKTLLQTDLKNYLTAVITIDWPLMKKGIHRHREDFPLINHMTQILNDYVGLNNQHSLLIHDIFDELKILYNARENRIHTSFQSLNPAIWIVIVLGTILTIAINYLFGMNFYLHLIAACSIGLMAASMIYLLITLDRPFQGEFAIQPAGYESMLTYIEADMKKEQAHPANSKIQTTRSGLENESA